MDCGDGNGPRPKRLHCQTLLSLGISTHTTIKFSLFRKAEMRIVFNLLLLTAFCGSFFGQFGFGLAVPIIGSHPLHQTRHHVISKDLTDTVDDMYNSYLSVSDKRRNNKSNVVSRIPRVLEEPQEHIKLPPENGKPKTYFLIKTLRPRDKRYTSGYLTLCHFKICNMGRKRTTRYFHMIKPLDDNGS